jgi:hypothetical protein
MNASNSVHHIGRQRVRIRGNLAEVTFTGTITVEEIKELFAFYDRIIAEHGHLCVLGDMQQSYTIDPMGRRFCLEWARLHGPHYHLAVLGGSRPIRTILTLLLGAIRILTGRYAAVVLFETAEEARRWLAPYIITPSHPEVTPQR